MQELDLTVKGESEECIRYAPSYFPTAFSKMNSVVTC